MDLIVSCGSLSSGGAERVLSVLSYHFVNEYKNVTYILWKHADIFYDIDEKVKIIDIEQLLNTTNEFRKILWFRSYIKNHSNSILLSFLYPYNMRVLFATIGLKLKIIIGERRDGSKVKGGKFIRVLRDILYTRASKIILQTQSNLKNYPECLRGNIYIIPNPIKLDRALVGKAITTPKKNYIVSVGRLITEKNHIFLVKVFKEFSKLHPEYSLIIYGEGPLKSALEMEVEKLGLSDKIILPGNVKNIEKYISEAKMFVLTSKSEGMPNALFEAMSLGLPCISTKVNGAIDYIQNGVNGFLIDSYSETQLLQCMLKLVEDNCFANQISHNATKIYSLLEPSYVNNCWTDILNNCES